MAPLSLGQLLALLAFSALMASGQILFKYGASQVAATNRYFGSIIGLALQPTILIGIAIYAVATILWLLILQKINLSRAYPFTALAFVIVPVASSFLFGEKLSLQYFTGIILIVVGVLIIGFAALSRAAEL